MKNPIRSRISNLKFQLSSNKQALLQWPRNPVDYNVAKYKHSLAYVHSVLHIPFNNHYPVSISLETFFGLWSCTKWANEQKSNRTFSKIISMNDAGYENRLKKENYAPNQITAQTVGGNKSLFSIRSFCSFPDNLFPALIL